MDETVEFLVQYQWIYNFKLIHFFHDRVWEHIPSEWSEVLLGLSVDELNSLPLGNIKDDWPKSFKHFISKCLEYSLPREHTLVYSDTERVTPLRPSDIRPDIQRGMSVKKLHEVCHMTALIYYVTKCAGTNAVIDVGSGLGYLGQVLHCCYGHHILGLEGKQCHTSGAEKRSVRTEKCPGLQNVTCELQQTSSSMQEFLSSAQSWFLNLPPDVSLHSHKTGTRTCISCSQTSMKRNELQTGKQDHIGAKSSSRDNADELGKVSERAEVPCSENERTKISHTKAESANILGLEYERSKVTDLKSERVTVLCAESEVPNKPDLESDMPNMLISESEKTEMLDRESVGANKLNPKPDRSKVLDPESDRLKMLDPEKDGCIDKEKWRTTSGGVCMVGLHCCGDLTPTMLRYFVEMECIRGLCCVSCCYHRMNYNEATNQFENFPMSQYVQETVAKISDRFPEWSLNTYAMRLAAQETRARWHKQNTEDHDFHARNVAYRALLEMCLEEGHFALKKTARKLAHKKDHSSFQAYLDKVIEHILFTDTDKEGEANFRHHMTTLYDRYHQYLLYIEPFTALQFLIQPVLESLIQKDRQLWLKENGYHSNIIPVFDEVLSPRNLALVAIKY